MYANWIDKKMFVPSAVLDYSMQKAEMYLSAVLEEVRESAANSPATRLRSPLKTPSLRLASLVAAAAGEGGQGGGDPNVA